MNTKRNTFRSTVLGAILILVGVPGVAQSDLVTKTFTATILEGPLEGQFGTGSFSYDNDILGDDIIGPEEGLTVSFTFDGQVFNETNDQSFNLFPELVFENYVPVELDFFLTDGVNGVNFTNPLLLELEMEDDLLPYSGSGDFDFETQLSAEVVPIPAAAWLLGGGLIGLLGLKRRFQN